METRTFQDESGRRWRVTKRRGSRFTVEGQRGAGEKLHDIARSCARRLGVTRTGTGAPLQYVNEHIRIWNAIWARGTKT